MSSKLLRTPSGTEYNPELSRLIGQVARSAPLLQMRSGQFRFITNGPRDAGGTAKAKAAYQDQDFLTLWKDADPDIPILIAAKAECAKLQ